MAKEHEVIAENVAADFEPPPIYPASDFALAATSNQFLLGMGQSMLIPVSGAPPRIAVSWGATFALSPQSAKKLHRFLSQAIAGYERQYGQIADHEEKK
jgi:hypothetical protein